MRHSRFNIFALVDIDFWLLIFEHLPPTKIIDLRLVCKEFRDIVNICKQFVKCSAIIRCDEMIKVAVREFPKVRLQIGPEINYNTNSLLEFAENVGQITIVEDNYTLYPKFINAHKMIFRESNAGCLVLPKSVEILEISGRVSAEFNFNSANLQSVSISFITMPRNYIINFAQFADIPYLTVSCGYLPYENFEMIGKQKKLHLYGIKLPNYIGNLSNISHLTLSNMRVPPLPKFKNQYLSIEHPLSITKMADMCVHKIKIVDTTITSKIASKLRNIPHIELKLCNISVAGVCKLHNCTLSLTTPEDYSEQESEFKQNIDSGILHATEPIENTPENRNILIISRSFVRLHSYDLIPSKIILRDHLIMYKVITYDIDIISNSYNLVTIILSSNTAGIYELRYLIESDKHCLIAYVNDIDFYLRNQSNSVLIKLISAFKFITGENICEKHCIACRGYRRKVCNYYKKLFTATPEWWK